MNKELLKGNSELLILSLLAGEPMHGYALSKKLVSTMPDMFRFGVGMLYPLLHKLEHEGLITSRWREIDNKNRRVYEVTKRGRRGLIARKKDWFTFQKTINTLVQNATHEQ